MDTKNDTTKPERAERAANSALSASPGSVSNEFIAVDYRGKHYAGPFETEWEAGSPLRFQRRPMLISGQLRVNPNYLVLVSAEDPEQEQAVTLWHEMVHLIKDAGGMPPEEQDEDEVEAAAKKLAECCPEILQWAFHFENDKDRHA